MRRLYQRYPDMLSAILAVLIFVIVVFAIGAVVDERRGL